MEKKSGNFFDQEVSAIASSPAAKKLLSFLMEQNSNDLKKAQDSIASGNYEKAIQALSGVLNSPDAHNLLTELEESHGRHE